ncbi:hypothetical protein [Cupriavidus ulmosensis]
MTWQRGGEGWMGARNGPLLLQQTHPEAMANTQQGYFPLPAGQKHANEPGLIFPPRGAAPKMPGGAATGDWRGSSLI